MFNPQSFGTIVFHCIVGCAMEQILRCPHRRADDRMAVAISKGKKYRRKQTRSIYELEPTAK